MMNQLDALAKNEGLLMRKGWSRARREAIESLPLSGWDTQRRKDLLELLDELDRRVRPLDEAVEKAAWEKSGCTSPDEPSWRGSDRLTCLCADHR